MQHSDQADKLFIRICQTSLEHFFYTHYQRPLQSALQFVPLQSLQQGAGLSLWHLLQWQFAEAVGISSRSLYSGFAQYVGLSPMQYVKQQRLQSAHQQLQHADPQLHTVTEIALLAGFSHLGQFAKDYQHAYGLRPSATLNKKSESKP